jgi:hypothetical protein
MQITNDIYAYFICRIFVPHTPHGSKTPWRRVWKMVESNSAGYHELMGSIPSELGELTSLTHRHKVQLTVALEAATKTVNDLELLHCNIGELNQIYSLCPDIIPRDQDIFTLQWTYT